MNPAEPIAHGGNGPAVAAALGLAEVPAVRLDFSVNLNPLGPPPAVLTRLWREMPGISAYPDAAAAAAERALAEAHGLAPEQVVAGNGSTEIFGLLLQAFAPRRAGWVAPCYAGYAEACRALNVPGAAVGMLTPQDGFQLRPEALAAAGADLVFVGSPNNPTGRAADPDLVPDAAARNPGCRFVVDESFIDFLPDPARGSLIGRALPPNVMVVKSLTKFFAIPGLRLGLACGAAEAMARLRAARLPWSVNSLAQSAAGVLYQDRAYLERSRRVTAELRAAFAAELAALPGWTVFPADANFLLVRLPDEWPVRRLQGELLRSGILIRSAENFEGLGPAYCRLAVRPRAETEELLDAVKGLLRPAAARARPPRKPAVMVVGTTSHAGKSIVAAGLCRVFARRGLRVAPFKAQNMALNSFVTADGGEMGRAQVTQARAARVEPHTDMNPVLLKPTGVNGSQVIVNGRAIGTFTAREYYSRKAELRQTARAAYDRLQSRFDLLVLEGAGSPAEINLRDEDFVNLDMAEYAGARAVLVADIDRGGVFASIFGTLNLLPPSQRRLVAGVLINKFRGDVSLLASGIQEIEALTGVPVLGVLPYLADLQIEEEDSLGIAAAGGRPGAALDIAVVRLPRISNYTDFLALERWNGVRVRYVTRPRELNGADLIILPGSKNTRDDLAFLHTNGFTPRIRALHGQGTPVFGICGGYQMMGGRVADPHGVEGEPGETEGLGLLPVETTLEKEKELAQVTGVTAAGCGFAAPGTFFRGYEIHAGRTSEPAGAAAPLRIRERRGAACDESAGAASEARGALAFGSYVHGLLDEEGMTRQLVAWLCRRKGLDPEPVAEASAPSPDAALDRVADMLEAHLDARRLEEWTHAAG